MPVLSALHAHKQSAQSVRINLARLFNTATHRRAQELEAQIRLAGVAPSDDDPRDRAYEPSGQPLRPVDLSAYFPPIFDQGNKGTCTANATVAALMALASILGVPPVLLARMFQYWNSLYYDGSLGAGDVGATGRSTARAAKNFGICREDLMPYATAVGVEPDPAAFTDALLHRLSSYSVILPNPNDTYQTFNLITDALMQKKPVLFYFQCRRYHLYQQGELFTSNYLPPYPLTDYMNEVVGGHVEAVSASDGANWLTCRGSWGASFGYQGQRSVHRLTMYGVLGYPFEIRVYEGLAGATPVDPNALTLAQIRAARQLLESLKLGVLNPDDTFTWVLPTPPDIAFHIAIKALEKLGYSTTQMQVITGMPAANIDAFKASQASAYAAYKSL